MIIYTVVDCQIYDQYILEGGKGKEWIWLEGNHTLEFKIQWANAPYHLYDPCSAVQWAFISSSNEEETNCNRSRRLATAPARQKQHSIGVGRNCFYIQINTMRCPTPTECCFCRAGAVAKSGIPGVGYTHDAAAREECTCTGVHNYYGVTWGPTGRCTKPILWVD